MSQPDSVRPASDEQQAIDDEFLERIRASIAGPVMRSYNHVTVAALIGVVDRARAEVESLRRENALFRRHLNRQNERGGIRIDEEPDLVPKENPDA